MVTKKRDLSKDELLRSFHALPDESTVEDFIEHLAQLIGLDRSEPDQRGDFGGRMKKEKLMESLGRLPVEATIDDFAYRLYVIAKIENAMAESAAGNKVSHEEARERLKHWLE
jgi:hypothetical protein